MKITKNQLRRIIKEEKQKLLVEMNPIADAERMLGGSVPQPELRELGSIMRNILQKIEIDLIEDEGLEEDEAEFKAPKALALALAYELQSIGMEGAYVALYRALQRGEI